MDIIPYNGTTLAFIGDAVMTLRVREMFVKQGYQKPNQLHRLTSSWVSAKAQAKFVTKLMDMNFFTEEELQIIRRGRNATLHTMAKNADVATYRLATGLEAIIGYYQIYGEQERLELLWKTIVEIGAKK